MKPSNVWKKRYRVEKALLHRYKAASLFSCICVIICFCVSAHLGPVTTVESDCFPSLMELGRGCIQLRAFAVCAVQILLVRDKDGFMHEENMASLHSGKRNSAYVFPPVCVSRLVSSFGLPEPNVKCSRD